MFQETSIRLSNDELFAKGRRARDTIQTRIRGEADLRSIAAAELGATGNEDIRSCFVNMSILGKVVSNSQPNSAFLGPEVPEVAKVYKSMQLLHEGNFVVIEFKPNHYLCMLPMGLESVQTYQGYEGEYTLLDWVQNAPAAGRMDLSFIMENLFQVVNPDQPDAAKAAAAEKLFSFDGPDGATSARVRSDFGTENAKIRDIHYQPI